MATSFCNGWYSICVGLGCAKIVMHTTDTAEMKTRKPRTEAQKQLRRERRAANLPIREGMTKEEIIEHQKLRRNEMSRLAYRLNTQSARRLKEIEKHGRLQAEKQEKEHREKIALRRKQLAEQAKTIPTGFCNCIYCFGHILVYGDKQKIIPASTETPPDCYCNRTLRC